MLRRSHLLWCFVLGTFLTGTGYAQDVSSIWNSAKRVKLGLDKAWSSQQTPAGGAATMNPLSPPNTPDIQVFNPSNFWQSENSIGVNFSNPGQLMVSTNGQIPGSNPVVEQTWAFSTDGGNTWPSSLQSENIPPGIVDCFGDPVAFFDRSGRAYYCTLGSPGGIYFVSTTNFGATWSTRSNADLLTSTSDDKEHAAADYSGTFPNNVYVAWTDFGIASAPVVFARSTNQGASWQPRVQLGIGSNRGQGAHIGIGPNGEVYVIWGNYTTGTQEVGLGFAKSTDGGATFSTPVQAYPFTGIRTSNAGIPELNNTRATSFPYCDVDRSNGIHRGWIYTVHPELVSGQADVFLHRSTDGGSTWSSGIQVNGPDVQVGKWQWMASIAVDPTSGGISVSYYSMDSVGTNFMTNRYMAHSGDGGDTWDRFVVSDVRANWDVQGTPNTNGNYNGDYYETAAMSGKAWPIWTDRRLGAAGSNNRAYVQPIIYTEFFGWIRGTITNVVGGVPVPNVAVDFTDNINQQGSTTDGAGFYLAGAKVDTPGTTRSVTLRARKFAFRDTLITLTLTRNDTATHNIVMSPVASPTIVVNPASLVFPTTILGTSRHDSSAVRNFGLQTLTISSVTTTNARFAVTPGSLSLTYGDSARIRVTYSPLVTGTDTGRVILLSNDPGNPRFDIILSGTAGNHDIGILSLGGTLSAESPASGGTSWRTAAPAEKRAGKSDANTLTTGNVPPSLSIVASGDALLNFRALIRNYGAFVESTYQVGWSIDGIAQTPTSNAQPLQINRTDTLVLTWENPAVGVHIARAWTQLASDVNHSNDTSAPFRFNVLPPGVVFLEGFNDTIPPYPAGWHVKNRDGGGTTTWFSGNPAVFPPFEGTRYIGANSQAANGTTIDEWLVSPNTGGLSDAMAVDSLIFWQRSPGNQSPYRPDSIQIRVSTTDTAVASFTIVLDYFRTDTIGWRRKGYALPISANRFIAFRYLHYNGGSGPNSNTIGLDAVQIQRTFAATPGWVTQTSGVSTALFSVKAVDPNTGWIGGAGGVVLRTTNSGDTWTSTGGGAIGTADIYAIEAVDASTAFVTTSPGGGGSGTFIYRTTNAGGSWEQVFTDPSAAAFVDAIRMYDANNGIALGDPVGGRWTILRTANGGASWVRDTVNAPLQVGTEAGSNNGMATVGTTHIWFTPNGNANRVYRTTDGGTTWASSVLPFTTFTAGIAFCNTQTGVVGGSLGTGQTVRTTDGGATWTSITIPGTGSIYGISATGTRDIFVAMGGNVYRSTDFGVTWATSLTGSIGTTLWYCSFATSGANTRGWVVSATGGIAAFYGSITGVREDVAGIPGSFAVLQNYPNPFNPTTRIRYNLPEQATVTLRIYNVLGQEIRTLANGTMAPGSYEALWDGRNGFGSTVSSGVYFYRFEATGGSGRVFSTLKKMLILK